MTIDALVKKVAQYYGLTDYEDIRRVPKGRSNSTYELKSHSTSLDYIIRVVHHFDPGLLENELAIYAQLEEHGFRTVRVLKAKNGKNYCKVDDDTYVVVSYKVNGRHLNYDEVGPKACSIIGRTLAQFHVAVKSLPSSSRSMVIGSDIMLWASENRETVSKLPLFNTLWDAAIILYGKELPRGVIHGDFHLDNCLFDGDVGIAIDMERAGHGAYIFDIARTVMDVCSTAGEFDNRKYQSLIDAYSQVRKLNAQEVRYMPSAIAHVVLFAASWLLKAGDEAMAKRFIRVGVSALNYMESPKV